MLNKIIAFVAQLDRESELDVLISNTTGWLQETITILKSGNYDRSIHQFATYDILPRNVVKTPINNNLFNAIFITVYLLVSLSLLRNIVMFFTCSWTQIENVWASLRCKLLIIIPTIMVIQTIGHIYFSSIVHQNKIAMDKFRDAISQVHNGNNLYEIFESEYKDYFRWDVILYNRMMIVFVMSIVALFVLFGSMYALYIKPRKEVKINEEVNKTAFTLQGKRDGNYYIIDKDVFDNSGMQVDVDYDGSFIATIHRSVRKLKNRLQETLPIVQNQDRNRPINIITSTPATKKMYSSNNPANRNKGFQSSSF